VAGILAPDASVIAPSIDARHPVKVGLTGAGA
jgi:hypothetical protein